MVEIVLMFVSGWLEITTVCDTIRSGECPGQRLVPISSSKLNENRTGFPPAIFYRKEQKKELRIRAAFPRSEPAPRGASLSDVSLTADGQISFEVQVRKLTRFWSGSGFGSSFGLPTRAQGEQSFSLISS